LVIISEGFSSVHLFQTHQPEFGTKLALFGREIRTNKRRLRIKSENRQKSEFHDWLKGARQRLRVKAQRARPVNADQPRQPNKVNYDPSKFLRILCKIQSPARVERIKTHLSIES
jgi:hypothetical protein